MDLYLNSIDIEQIATNWIYLAEGNVQIVFQYIGNHPELIRKVLKIPKNCIDVLSSNLTTLYLNYTRNVIYPWFHSSVCNEIREIVVLNKDFCQQLFQSLVGLNIRYNQENDSKCIQSNHHSSLIGIIERNMNCISFIPSSSSSSNSLPSWSYSIEIKVKSGLTSCSPFVASSNQIKYRVGRYQLMQAYKHGKRVEYDPCDLCSSNEHRIRKAVDMLISTNSKHLKMGINGRFIEKPTSLFSVLNVDDTYHSVIQSEKSLLDLLSIVISNSTICQDLQTVQGLDFIDVEGVYSMYQKLVELYGNDELMALNAMNERLQHSIPSIEKFKDLSAYFNIFRDVSNSQDPIILPDKSILSSFCSSDVDIVSKIISLYYIYLSYRQNVDDEEQRRINLSTWLLDLSIQDCLDIIHMWLASLVAKDASVIIAFEEVYSPLGNSRIIDQPDNISLVHRHSPDINSSGCIDCYLSNVTMDSSHHGYHRDHCYVKSIAYEIGLTDIVPKDMKKIWNKIVKENEICNRASEVYNTI